MLIVGPATGRHRSALTDALRPHQLHPQITLARGALADGATTGAGVRPGAAVIKKLNLKVMDQQ
jgi:hypothetical protein